MASKSAKEMTTNFTDIEVSRLGFTDLEDNQRSKGQKIAYPRYNHPTNGNDSPLFIQFPWIQLNSYGVPRLGEYYKDDSQRSFVKIPLDQSIPEIKQFSELLREIDETLGSDEFKEKNFGAKASKYDYQPIYRLPQEEDEDEKKDSTKKDYGPRHPYMKLKIDTTYPDNKVKSIVFKSVPGEGTKRIRTKIDTIETIDDFASNVCFMSKIRPIGRPVKLWAQTKASGNSKTLGYGLTFKMAKVEVEPPAKNTSQVRQYLESDAFLDSDEESEGEVAQPVSKTVTPAKKVAQVDSDSDEESDEDVQPAAKTVTPAKKVAQVDSESDSDEESDEEVKPAKKPAKPAAKPAAKTKKASA